MNTEIASVLLDAFERREAIDPLTSTHPGLTVDDAYAIQRALVAGHAAAGRAVAGRKVGLTNAAIQAQLGVDSPDWGVLFDTMTFDNGATVSIAGIHGIAARIEAEIGFVLSEPLSGPGLGAGDVLAATAHVLPVLEIVDSRIRDWKITLIDTVSDNASGLASVLGAPVALADAGPLPDVAMAFTRDGEQLGAGTGANVLGDPAVAVAWLANELGRYGEELPAGQPILSGAMSAMVDLQPGHHVADFGPAFGSVSVEVVA